MTNLPHISHANPARSRQTVWRLLSSVCATALVAGALAVTPAASSPVAALPTDINLQTMNVSPVTSSGSPGQPGQNFTYTIGFSCDSTVSGTCAGAIIDGLLPRFTDVFGTQNQLISVGTPTGTSGIWSSGPTFSGLAGEVSLTGTLNATAVAGQIYSVTFVARAPVGLFPPGQTTLTNVATSSGTTSPTVTSVVGAVAPSWTITKAGPPNLLIGANGTYTIRACPTAPNAAFPQTFTVTDLLPAGANFVSASNGGVAPVDNPADGVNDQVTWTFDATNRPWPMNGNCVNVTQVVSYAENIALNNVTGVTKTNTASGTYDELSLGSSGVGTELRGPITAVRIDKNVSSGGYYVAPGDAVQYALEFDNTSETGAAPLDGATIIDDLTAAPYFSLNTIDTGTWPGGVPATVEVSSDGVAYTPVTGSPFDGSSSANVATPGSNYVRWRFTGTLPVGFATNYIRLNGVMLSPPTPPLTQTNCASVTATRGANDYTDPDCAEVLLETPQPDPRINKTIISVVAADGTAHTATTVAPGDTISTWIRVTNGADATGDLTDPVIVDCVARTAYMRDPVLTLGAGWSTDVAYVDATCTSAGGTPVRLTYSGQAITPNQTVTAVTYTVEVTEFGDLEGVALPGSYPNTAVLTKETGLFNHGTLTSTVTATVPAYIFLASQKWVLGSRDIDAGRVPDRARKAGETDPGGSMTWYINVQNKGNVAARNPVYVDVFSHVGDTGVKRIDQFRDSEWAPYLVEKIAAPAGWAVQYSTSSNPCRREVGPNPSSPAIWPAGCETPNWTTDDGLYQLVTYKSIRLEFVGSIPVGDPEIQFSWDMRAPVYDPSYDGPGADPTNPYERLAGCNMDPNPSTQDPATVVPCPRAINSFAWAAEADPTGLDPALNPGRLSTEPPRVGVQIRELPDVDNIIGDRVWYDSNFNGLQDVGEAGVGGIYVELFRFDSISGWLRYGYTFTDPNGNYLFATPGVSLSGLPDGDYRVRFSLPANYYISPRDADGLGASDRGTTGTPANGNTDSDVPQIPSGVGVGGAYYETPTITLGTNETDLTWDAGIWDAAPSITIDKVTRDTAWNVADAGDGVTVVQGRPLEWRYTIANTGNTRLQNVVITDDNGTVANVGDDFTVTACVITNQGTNENGTNSSPTAPIVLNRGAIMTCTATGTAGTGSYANIAGVVGAPTLDNGALITRGTPPATVTDNDDSSYDVITYDLAIAKTVSAPNYPTGNVVFEITVQNQGDIDSGLYSITDTLPAGMSFVSASIPPTTPTASSLVWTDRPNLASGASVTFTLTLHIDDYLLTPFRNIAEISADSASSVMTAGHPTPTADIDSNPDANTGNDMPTPKTYGPAGNPTAGGADTIDVDLAGTGTDGEDDADIADVITVPTYDLALAKIANATNLAGDGSGTIVYTVTVINQGNVASGAYDVTDTVPAGLTVSGPVPGGGVVTVGNPTRIVWTGSNLAPGDSTSFTYTATVADLTQRPFRNFAEISSDSAQTLYGTDDVDSTPDTNTGNDMPTPKTYGPRGTPTAGGADNIAVSEAGTGTDGEDDADIADVDLPQSGNYDLALAKTVDAVSVAYDGTITYTITIQNQGVLDSRAITVTDTYPAGLTPVDLDGAVDNGDGTITWSINNLPAGATTTRTMTAAVADITLRPFRNYAEISSDSADTYSSPGEPVTDIDSTPDANISNDGNYGVVMTVNPIDNVTVGNTPAIAMAGVGADSPTSAGQDDADIADVDIPVVYDLALIKTGPATVDDDGTVEFTITVANQGNVPSGVFDVTDTVPAGMVAIAASNGGTFAIPTVAVIWNDLASLDPSDTIELTVKLDVTDYRLRPFVNVAEITADSADSYSTATSDVTDADSVPGDSGTSVDDNEIMGQAGTATDVGFDDEDIASVTLNPAYDLALIKVADTATTTFNGTVIFTITVANQGNVPSGVFEITDTLPAGTAFRSASNRGALTGDGTRVVWTMPSIEPGATVNSTVTVEVTDITKRPFVNRADITADSAASYSLPNGPTLGDIDSVPGDPASSTPDNLVLGEAGAGDDSGFDDEDIARFDVPVIYDLELDKTLVAGQSFRAGSTIAYTISVSNKGNVPSGSYSVQDALPAGMSFVSASDGGVSNGNLVTWTDLGSLDPGSSRTVTVGARLDDVSLAAYDNVAEIIADGSAALSTPTETVTDRDSRPNTPEGDTTPGQDDWDSASLPLGLVAAHNVIPPVTTQLAAAGAGIMLVLGWALAVFAAGAGMTHIARRRKCTG